VRASFLGHIAKVKWVTLDNAAHFLYVDQRGWYMELVGVFFGGGRCLGECECGSGAEAGGAGGFGDGLGLFSNHVAMHHTAIPEPCDSSPSMRVIKLLMDAVYYCLPAQPIHHHLLPKP